MNMLPRLAGIVFYLLAAALVSSCAQQRVLLPRFDGRLLSAAEQNKLAETLLLKAQEVKSLRLLCDVTLEEKEKIARLREAIVFEKPQRLRLESFPETSFVSLNLFVVDAGKGVFMDNTAREAFMTGDAARLIRRYYKIPLDPADIIGIVSGRLPEEEIAAMRKSADSRGGDYEVYEDEAGARYVITRISGAVVWIVNKDSALLDQVIYNNIFNESVTLRVNLENVINAEGIALPTKEIFEMEGEGIKLEFLVHAYKINQISTNNLFEVQVPLDYAVHDFDG